MALSAILSGTAFAEGSSDHRLLRFRQVVFDPLVGIPELPSRLRYTIEPEAGYFVIQFRQSIDAELLASIKNAGAEPIHYLPDRGYVVRIAKGGTQALRDLPQVRWIGPLQPGWKLSPELGTREIRDPVRRQGNAIIATLDLFPGEPAQAVEQRLAALEIELLQRQKSGDTERLRVRASRHSLQLAASIQAVEWIEEAGEVHLRNDEASWVIQSNLFDVRPIWDQGIHGEGEVIGHIDGALDLESCYFRDSTDNTPGPNHRKVVAYRSSVGTGFADGHGTHTAGTAAGNQTPINGTDQDNGNAWAARISHSTLGDIDGSGTTPSNLYDFLVAAHGDGARVHTNSWGDDGTTSYTTWSRDIDQFSWDFEESLVVFAVTNRVDLRSPENAKDLLAVGATLNGGDSRFFCSGGIGPTIDGRRKPEIFAPGCGIVSALADSECGAAANSGTSMATPAVSGAAALTRQYFREGWYPSGTKNSEDARVASGALLKATLLNATVDLSGVAGYPSEQEGWGKLLLDNALYFDGDTPRLVVMADIRNATGLGTGVTDPFPLLVEGRDEPLKLTLVFTEPPGALLAASATVNNLDLEVVSPTGVVYLGNVIVNGASQTGGSADPINNVEMVIVPDPELGEWTVSVIGTAVNEARQGYALVATGEVSSLPGGSLRYAGHVVSDGGDPLDTLLGNGDGVVDPGETITLPLTLFNLRDRAVSDVSAVVSTTRSDLARVTLDDQSYPDFGAFGTAGSSLPHYRFTVPPDAACGSLIPFGIHAVHAEGTTDSTFVLRIGETESERTSTDTPIAMPPFSGTPNVSTIEVAGNFLISDLQAELHITHADVSHLVVELISPLGTVVRLHNRTGAGTANINTVFDSQRDPDGPGNLDNFNGQSAQGAWRLSVLDQVIGGFPPTPGGTIESWTLSIDSSGTSACTPLECATDPVPDAVNPAMIVDVAGDDLVLNWPAVAGATSYRVWRSPTAEFATERLVGSSTEATRTLIGELTEPGNWYYRVRAVNSCNWEGL